MVATLKGSCLCGGVAYEIRGAPKLMYHCHCGTCRKANGAARATNLIVAVEDFSVVAGRESLSSFESSPRKRRFFCGRCGSPLYSHSEATPQIVSVRAGTLDADPGLRPALHTHVASRAAWDEISDDVPQRPEGLG